MMYCETWNMYSSKQVLHISDYVKHLTFEQVAEFILPIFSSNNKIYWYVILITQKKP